MGGEDRAAWLDRHCQGIVDSRLAISLNLNAPIGVFDSGIGGLSVLRHIHAILPDEDLLYFADSGFAPYGDKPEHEILARVRVIAEFLLRRDVKAMVVACNTATVAAIKTLRACYPNLALVGVEPGLKPAAALSKTRTVGVLATRRTLSGAKFVQLHKQISAATGVRFVLQGCSGLADQIEQGHLRTGTTRALVAAYLKPMLEQGADTIVLGCTHYPFILPLIEECIGEHTSQALEIVDTGAAVARQLARLLGERQLLRAAPTRGGSLIGFTSGDENGLALAFADLLGLRPEIVKFP